MTRYDGVAPGRLHAEYSSGFYDSFDAIACSSAKVIVQRVYEAVRPRSVVDFGCGRGYWLEEFLRCGTKGVLGLDGGEVEPESLRIPRSCYRDVDIMLIGTDAHAFEIGKIFDLAVCLEVAEHLPEPRAAALVGELVRAAPVVLFSAAIPGQGGTGHVNEQWPVYWAKLFAEHQYLAVDNLRLSCWGDDRVAYWYQQNIMYFAAPKHASVLGLPTATPLSIVHPEVYESKLLGQQPLGLMLRQFPRAAIESAKYRLRIR